MVGQVHDVPLREHRDAAALPADPVDDDVGVQDPPPGGLGVGNGRGPRWEGFGLPKSHCQTLGVAGKRLLVKSPQSRKMQDPDDSSPTDLEKKRHLQNSILRQET